MLVVEVSMKFYARTFKDVWELVEFVNNVLGAAPAKYTILGSTSNGTIEFIWEGP